MTFRLRAAIVALALLASGCPNISDVHFGFPTGAQPGDNTPDRPGPGQIITFLHGTSDYGGTVLVVDQSTGKQGSRYLDADQNIQGCSNTLQQAATDAGMKAKIVGGFNVSVKIWGNSLVTVTMPGFDDTVSATKF